MHSVGKGAFALVFLSMTLFSGSVTASCKQELYPEGVPFYVKIVDGHLAWSCDGSFVPGGASLQVRDDFSYKVQYLRSRPSRGDRWIDVDRVLFAVEHDGKRYDVEISAKGGVFQWRANGEPLQICDHLADSDREEDPLIRACSGSGIPIEFYGAIRGPMVAERRGTRMEVEDFNILDR